MYQSLRSKRAANAGTGWLGGTIQPPGVCMCHQLSPSGGFSSEPAILPDCVWRRSRYGFDFRFSAFFLRYWSLCIHFQIRPTTTQPQPHIENRGGGTAHLNEQENILILCALQRAREAHTAQINICFSSHVPENCLPAVCTSLHSPPNNFLILPIGQFSPSLTEKQQPKRNKVSTGFMKTGSQLKESKLISAKRKAATWNQIPWDMRAGTSLWTSSCRKTFKHSSHTNTLQRTQLHNTRSQAAKLPLLVKQFVSIPPFPFLPLKLPSPR